MRLLALVVACLAAGAAPGADLKPVDESTYPKLLAAARGKVVLVNFWATYCVPCRKEMPALLALAARYKAKGFELITISADEAEDQAKAAAFLDKSQAPAPAYIKRAHDDEKFINAIDPKWSGALPASFLYDRTGRKARSIIGEADMAELEALIRKLL